MQFIPLPALQRPLLDKFYRSHRCSMRSKGEARIWVAKAPEIVAALNLTPMVNGHWLTGLFVAPERRGNGIAGRLIEAAVAEATGSVWLFCDPGLIGFYQRLGFTRSDDLPLCLAERLARYQRTKALIALGRKSAALQPPVG